MQLAGFVNTPLCMDSQPSCWQMGRRRKYGDKFTLKIASALPEHRKQVFLYSGSNERVLSERLWLAKFMHGHKVRSHQGDDGITKLKTPEPFQLEDNRLILSTLNWQTKRTKVSVILYFPVSLFSYEKS